jgi:hypothetical protein
MDELQRWRSYLSQGRGTPSAEEISRDGEMWLMEFLTGLEVVTFELVIATLPIPANVYSITA